MKILKIESEGLPLFKGKLELWFYALQRIDNSARDSLIKMDDKYYVNPVQAVIGRNASGKTTILKTVTLILHMLAAEPINSIATKTVLGNNGPVTINSYFYSKNQKTINRLKTVIEPTVGLTGTTYSIVNEELYSKPAYRVPTKKNLLDFTEKDKILSRDSDETFLSEDVSIIISLSKKYKEKFFVDDILSMTDTNIMPVKDDIPASIIGFLDPSIERISFGSVDNSSGIHLKFKGKDEILLRDSRELNIYLSSGTIKGIVAFMIAKEMMQKGGYLIIDELENHFNKEIAATLIRFFQDNYVNSNGGVLLFSTHYAELLDEFSRNDSIYVTKNNDGIVVKNLMYEMKRNDISKSTAYLSGMIDDTIPEYESYMMLRKNMIADTHRG